MNTRPRGSLGDAQWAYCEHCRRDVELLPAGRLASHTTHTGAAYKEEQCKGSLRRPSLPPQERGKR